MRFMVLVKANKESEAGEMPTSEMLTAMSQYNDELAKAGVLLDLSGLRPSKQGKRVRFQGAKPSVVDGPFTEAKELIAGYWILQCKSWEECVEWVKRAPMAPGDELEIRQFFELEDFALTPEQDAQFRATEAKLKDRPHT
jgi:hypothetical protein